MYNRYIPQPDGTYQKHRLNEPTQPRPPKPKPQPVCPAPSPNPAPCDPPEPQPICPHEKKPQYRPPTQSNGNILGFFKNLLPKGLDTADLLIILLLLLMAGDCEEDKNTALLTLALYFFL